MDLEGGFQESIVRGSLGEWHGRIDTQGSDAMRSIRDRMVTCAGRIQTNRERIAFEEAFYRCIEMEFNDEVRELFHRSFSGKRQEQATLQGTPGPGTRHRGPAGRTHTGTDNRT